MDKLLLKKCKENLVSKMIYRQNIYFSVHCVNVSLKSCEENLSFDFNWGSWNHVSVSLYLTRSSEQSTTTKSHEDEVKNKPENNSFASVSSSSSSVAWRAANGKGQFTGTLWLLLNVFFVFVDVHSPSSQHQSLHSTSRHNSHLWSSITFDPECFRSRPLACMLVCLRPQHT